MEPPPTRHERMSHATSEYRVRPDHPRLSSAGFSSPLAAVFVSSSLGRFFPLVPSQDSEYSDVPPAQPRCHIITAGEFEASEQTRTPSNGCISSDVPELSLQTLPAAAPVRPDALERRSYRRRGARSHPRSAQAQEAVNPIRFFLASLSVQEALLVGQVPQRPAVFLSASRICDSVGVRPQRDTDHVATPPVSAMVVTRSGSLGLLVEFVAAGRCRHGERVLSSTFCGRSTWHCGVLCKSPSFSRGRWCSCIGVPSPRNTKSFHIKPPPAARTCEYPEECELCNSVVHIDPPPGRSS